MPRYGYGSDSQEQYQGTPFDALTGRLNGGQLVMQVLNQIAALKDKKQQNEWDIEDREINKKYKEAATANLLEPNIAPKQDKPKGYQLPAGVRKQVAQYHGFKDEAEYDQYDPQMQQKMFEEYLDAKQEAAKFGLKGSPNRSAIAKVKAIGDAIKQVDSRAGDISKYLNAMTMQPMSDPDGKGKAEANRMLANLRRVQWRMAAIARKVDDNGNLPPAYEQELQQYLNMPSGVESGEVFNTQKPSAPKADKIVTAPAGKGQKDKFGYVVGEERDFSDGRYRYLGNDQWQLVK